MGSEAAEGVWNRSRIGVLCSDLCCDSESCGDTDDDAKDSCDSDRELERDLVDGRDGREDGASDAWPDGG